MVLLSMVGFALADAPTPFPFTVNSESENVPALTVYAAGARTFRVTFTDGTNASVLTGYTPFMAWSTSATAGSVVTASYSVVSVSNGIVDFTFSPSDLNHTAGRYLYEVGTKYGAVPTVYRQGVFNIKASPYSSGASPVTWTSNINWAIYHYLSTATYGPLRPDNTTITCTTNLDGSLRISATGTNAVSWNAILGKPNVVTNVVVSGGILTVSGTAQKTVGLTTNAIQDATKVNINAGGLTGNVPVTVEQTISHTNLLNPNGAADVQHLTAAEKNVATGAVASSRLDADLQTLAVNDGGSLTNVNALYLAGELFSYYLDLSHMTGVLPSTAQGNITRLGTITNGNVSAIESDPNWAAVSNGITTQAGQGAAAYGWGNHATQNYLKTNNTRQSVTLAPGGSAGDVLRQGTGTNYWWTPTWLTSYVRSIVGAGTGYTVAATTNGTEVTYGITVTAGRDWNAITNPPATYTPSAHSHSYTAITNAPWLTALSDTLQTILNRGDSATNTIRVYGLTGNKNGATVIQGKTGGGNSAALKQNDGSEDSWIEVGTNTIGAGTGPTYGIFMVSRGATKPIFSMGSQWIWGGDNGNTNFSLSAGGTANAKGGYQWNGTNVYQARNGSIGGTNSLFWTVNGTNYHMRLE